MIPMMKKSLILFFVMFGVASVMPLRASDIAPTLDLKWDLQEFQKMCPQPFWMNVKARWKGVKDLRPQAELAELEGNPPQKIYASKPLGENFDQAIQQIFQVCGIQWVKGTEEAAWEFEGFIEKFESGQQKGIFTSKTKAQSQVKIAAKSFQRGVEARVGYEIEMKASRFKSFKKIESTLQELFQKTLQQIVQSPDLRGIRAN